MSDRDKALIERIAQEWDGCIYRDVGEDIDIGDAIRRAYNKSQQPAQADKEMP